VHRRENTVEGVTDPQNPRINRLLTWLPHLEKMGIETVCFNPLFESDGHGYDTRDMRKVGPKARFEQRFKAYL